MLRVALRKESVDRNPGVLGWSPVGQTSLSARRAWIEICLKNKKPLKKLVALRKESVDRNAHEMSSQEIFRPSLSARRAWIEMLLAVFVIDNVPCRSPQGERG